MIAYLAIRESSGFSRNIHTNSQMEYDILKWVFRTLRGKLFKVAFFITDCTDSRRFLLLLVFRLCPKRVL